MNISKFTVVENNLNSVTTGQVLNAGNLFFKETSSQLLEKLICRASAKLREMAYNVSKLLDSDFQMNLCKDRTEFVVLNGTKNFKVDLTDIPGSAATIVLSGLDEAAQMCGYGSYVT